MRHSTPGGLRRGLSEARGKRVSEGTNLDANQEVRGIAASTDSAEPYACVALSGHESGWLGGVVEIEVVDEAPSTFDARALGVARLNGNAVCGNVPVSSGVGIDGDGDLWVIHRESCGNSAFDDRVHDRAVCIELEPDALDGWHDPRDGAATRSIVKTMVDTGTHAYTYSDFIGQQLLTLVAPRGRYRAVFEGWQTDTPWRTAWRSLSAALADGSAAPRLSVSYRVADSRAALAAAEWSPPTSLTCGGDSCMLQLPDDTLGAFLELEVVLETDDEGEAPSVRSLSIRLQRRGA